MKKKTIERLAEERLNRIRDLEFLLSRRKTQIKELKEEIEGYRQVMQILEAFIIEGVEQKGEIIINTDALAKGLKTGYSIEVRGNEYILTKKE